MRGLALTVVAVLVLAGCDGRGRTDAVGAGDDLPDCSSSGCAEEVAAYADAVGALPDVTGVRDVAYEPAQATDSASVSGTITVPAGTDCDSLEDDLGRLLWESRVSPVAYVALRCHPADDPDGSYDQTGFSFSLKDTDELTEQWGPRGG